MVEKRHAARMESQRCGFGCKGRLKGEVEKLKTRNSNRVESSNPIASRTNQPTDDITICVRDGSFLLILCI